MNLPEAGRENGEAVRKIFKVESDRKHEIKNEPARSRKGTATKVSKCVGRERREGVVRKIFKGESDRKHVIKMSLPAAEKEQRRSCRSAWVASVEPGVERRYISRGRSEMSCATVECRRESFAAARNE